MTQEVFMPDGHKIFSTDNPKLMYDEKTMQSMIKNGYVVKIDGKKKRLRNDYTQNNLKINPLGYN